jgi:hypothetical protein
MKKRKIKVNSQASTSSSSSLSSIWTRLVPSIINATGFTAAASLAPVLCVIPDVIVSFLDATKASSKLFLEDCLELLLIIIEVILLVRSFEE